MSAPEAPRRAVRWAAFRFAAVICAVCSLIVSTTSVALRDRQEANMLLDQRRKVLEAAGLKGEKEHVDEDAVRRRFERYLEARLIALPEGRPSDAVDPSTFDPRRASRNPDASRAAPANAAGVQRVPKHTLVYRLVEGGGVVLPIEGQGLWSTLYGFLALEADGNTVRGIRFYEHGETPGLGGEIDSPAFRRHFVGRRVFDQDGRVRLEVIKGRAGPPGKDPYRVDGITGATLTGRGVSNLLHFWLGPEGFGNYLARLRDEGEQGS